VLSVVAAGAFNTTLPEAGEKTPPSGVVVLTVVVAGAFNTTLPEAGEKTPPPRVVVLNVVVFGDGDDISRKISPVEGALTPPVEVLVPNMSVVKVSGAVVVPLLEVVSINAVDFVLVFRSENAVFASVNTSVNASLTSFAVIFLRTGFFGFVIRLTIGGFVYRRLCTDSLVVWIVLLRKTNVRISVFY
jgi:hypothetical protein